MSVPNILATRYASAAMRSIWTPENKIRAERDKRGSKREVKFHRSQLNFIFKF